MKNIPAIELEHVHFRYGRTELFRNISFSIVQGEYAGIVGPNGSGKSTLLKLMLGVLQPSSGTIRILGEDTKNISARTHVGYVPQHITQTDRAFPATVEEVVLSGRTPRKKLFHRFTSADFMAATHAMERSGIDPLRKRKLHELSGGERQRVFIARALATEPAILILDEPTVGIDAASQEMFYEFLHKLNADGITILVVSHDTHALMHEVKCMLCLQEGELCHCTLDDLKDHEHIHKHAAGLPHHSSPSHHV